MQRCQSLHSWHLSDTSLGQGSMRSYRFERPEQPNSALRGDPTWD